MTHSMQAIGIAEPGGPEVLQLITCDIPEIGENDVLIKVKAAGINRPDILQRQGLYPVPPDASPHPGLEVAGEVIATGDQVSSLEIGERVMALTHGGGYAEYCRANEHHCLRIPDNLSDVEAAAIPETFFTVYYNVFTRGALASGETILIHGGSSGIGTTAIQLAKAHGCKVLITAGNDKKCKFCLELGADLAINYRTEDWETIAIEASNGKGPDLVLDMVAGPYMQKNINVLARDGRYIIIAFLQGPSAELNMRAIIGKRLTITGSALRPQTDAEKADIANNIRENVLPLLESGAVKPIIYHSFPLAEANRAHELMETSHHMGKIVLEVA
jgi:NADPH2:quinone reductase